MEGSQISFVVKRESLIGLAPVDRVVEATATINLDICSEARSSEVNR